MRHTGGGQVCGAALRIRLEDDVADRRFSRDEECAFSAHLMSSVSRGGQYRSSFAHSSERGDGHRRECAYSARFRSRFAPPGAPILAG